MEDFEFYGEGTDEEEEKVIKGVTGDVTDFTYTGLEYPCIVFNEDFKCPKHQLTIIRNMVNSKVSGKDISLYFVNSGELYKIGMIDGRQVNAFLEVVGESNVTGFFSETKKLRNSMLYTLCTVN